ncbi:MAG TPA: prepilin-type N-terminal cleavage/methylation domain-containing protein [Candidatus Saccharimonadales bacterium]|nr:prepilin-type N-terminal cleavage/methylation domain-containing protein [Candidatus Saccharimonadales bacterium]
MNKREQGFSVVEVLVVLVVVAVIGSAGFVVYNRGKHDGKADNAQTTSATKQTTKDASAKPADESATTYLDIKEWGVKLPLSDALAGATYQLKNGYAYVTVKSLENTDYSLENGGVGAISRFTPTRRIPIPV